MPSAPASAPVRIRRADSSDLDDLVRLEQCAFDGDRMSRAQYRRHLASDSARILLASAGRYDFLGSVVLFFRRRSTLARVYSLATRPEARGRGIGAALLAAAAAAARRRGCRALRLEVRTDNAAAIGLYERLGYRRFGSYAHYYQDGTDAWRYEQVLD
ncbi:MAG: GNAT family N-acetyltransferase [Rhodanobacter sp.]|nr:MAG: GNAT family N-acetyltransferase [Rhodanobacter sp.]TAM04458.1 MAG: GNAT family N-acetyltransferase [Rhodanobacter sp.]TAM40627.1 MAG: GNAT family N-acetyltransferase [Rhodanobacter sp.]TAN25544.1 MAG: GNAT family N-acetyltransferase [Rhodanobacter sp.]